MFVNMEVCRKNVHKHFRTPFNLALKFMPVKCPVCSMSWEISSRSFYSCWVIFQDEQKRPVGANLIFPQEELSSQSRQHQSVTFLLSMERAFYFWQLRKLPIKLFRAVTIPAPALGWKWHQTEISGLFSSPQSWFPAVKCSNARNPRAGNYERTPLARSGLSAYDEITNACVLQMKMKNLYSWKKWK